MRNAKLLNTIDQRLQALGLSERKACLKAGLNVSAIQSIRKGRAPRASTIAALAPVLQVPAAELMGMVDEIADAEAVTTIHHEDGGPPPGYVSIPTLDVRVGAGGQGLADDDLMGPPQLLPEYLVRGELRGEPHDFLLVDVEGQSMSPVLESGDRVLVDRRKNNPSQGGIFCLWDGFGLVVKWLERIPMSDPPRLRIFSENARFSAYETTMEEARIIGRVVWFARRV